MRVRQNPNKKNKSPLYDRCWRAASFLYGKLHFERQKQVIWHIKAKFIEEGVFTHPLFYILYFQSAITTIFLLFLIYTPLANPAV